MTKTQLDGAISDPRVPADFFVDVFFSEIQQMDSLQTTNSSDPTSSAMSSSSSSSFPSSQGETSHFTIDVFDDDDDEDGGNKNRHAFSSESEHEETKKDNNDRKKAVSNGTLEGGASKQEEGGNVDDEAEELLRQLRELDLEDIEGMELSAMWEDTAFGLKHWSDFKRLALVSDVEWVSGMTAFFGWMIPAEVKTFKEKDVAAAREWVCTGH